MQRRNIRHKVTTGKNVIVNSPDLVLLATFVRRSNTRSGKTPYNGNKVEFKSSFSEFIFHSDSLIIRYINLCSVKSSLMF
jgi:hypothetical protein